MNPATRSRGIVIGLVVVISAAGWWGYGEHQKRELRKTIVALAENTGARMRIALTAATEGPDAVRELEDHASAVERNLAELKLLSASREPALAEAADDYILTGREILKRVVNVQRYRQLLAESLPALIAHMRADNHSGAWVQQAVKARERVNQDHRGLSLAASALDTLLQSFPASQKKIAPYVAPVTLVEGSVIDAARARALEAVKQADAEIEKTRRIDAFR